MLLTTALITIVLALIILGLLPPLKGAARALVVLLAIVYLIEAFGLFRLPVLPPR